MQLMRQRYRELLEAYRLPGLSLAAFLAVAIARENKLQDNRLRRPAEVTIGVYLIYSSFKFFI